MQLMAACAILVGRKPGKTQNGGKEALSVGPLITYSGGAANGEDSPGVAKTKDGSCDFDLRPSQQAKTIPPHYHTHTPFPG